jgi:hypothetical protein
MHYFEVVVTTLFLAHRILTCVRGMRRIFVSRRMMTQIDRQPSRQRLVVLGAQKNSPSGKSSSDVTAPLFAHYNGLCQY